MINKSDAADAERFRWLLDGHGGFFEYEAVCVSPNYRESEPDEARGLIDFVMLKKQLDIK